MSPGARRRWIGRRSPPQRRRKQACCTNAVPSTSSLRSARNCGCRHWRSRRCQRLLRCEQRQSDDGYSWAAPRTAAQAASSSSEWYLAIGLPLVACSPSEWASALGAGGRSTMIKPWSRSTGERCAIRLSAKAERTRTRDSLVHITPFSIFTQFSSLVVQPTASLASPALACRAQPSTLQPPRGRRDW